MTPTPIGVLLFCPETVIARKGQGVIVILQSS